MGTAYATGRRRAVAGALLLCCSSASGIAGAHTTTETLGQYWRLRERLRSEFVSLGEGPGDGIPAERRDATTIHYADATIHLGWYIGVLATELALLESPNHPGYDAGDAGAKARASSELAGALGALDRLDLAADAAFDVPCTSTPSLNGFFLRDDATASQHTKFTGLTATASDFLGSPAMKEMSQDQAVHLLVGLALVKKLVPSSLVVSSKGLRAQAVDAAVRIVTHMAVPNGWQITNPACGARLVARGADARGLSKGFSVSVGFMTNGATTLAADPWLGSLWDLLRTPNSLLSTDAQHMGIALAAVGRGFGASTFDDLVNLTSPQDWVLYPALHAALHGATGTLHDWPSKGPTVANEAKKLLDELPLGAEPKAPPAGAVNPHGWSSSQRFIRAKAEHRSAQAGSGMRMPGLDFMLLHNLRALTWPDDWSGPSFDAGAPLATTPDAATRAAGEAPQPAPPRAAASTKGEETPSPGCSMGARHAPPALALPLLGLLLWLGRRRR